MEEFKMEKTEKGFHIPGFSEAEKFIQIEHPLAYRLSDLYLHKVDLEFALECINKINTSDDRVIRKALFFSAIIYLYKCFTHSEARSQLPYEKVLKGDAAGIEVYNIYKDFRDMHIVHDANNISQCHTGAVLNKETAPHKIEKILCPSMIAELLDESNWNNVKLLTEKSLEWVINEFDRLADQLSKELEKIPYADLHAMPAVQLNKSEIDDVGKVRHARYKGKK